MSKSQKALVICIFPNAGPSTPLTCMFFFCDFFLRIGIPWDLSPFLTTHYKRRFGYTCLNFFQASVAKQIYELCLVIFTPFKQRRDRCFQSPESCCCTQVRSTLGRGVIHLKMQKEDLRRNIVTWFQNLFG